jgi:hypothetical protein
MTHSEPVSILTNYNKVLSKVDQGDCVVLTRNGVSRYAVVGIDEWNYTRAMLRFLSDMRDVDEEMRNGGQSYSEDELLTSLGIEG